MKNSQDSEGKILALDIGRKRTGFAVSDEARSVAFPRGVMDSSTLKKLLQEITKIVSGENISLIVLGLPLDSQHEEGEQVVRIRNLGARIEAETNIRVDYVDESHTSLEATEKLKEARRSARKEQLDAIAAQLILERYLASLVAGGGLEPPTSRL